MRQRRRVCQLAGSPDVATRSSVARVVGDQVVDRGRRRARARSRSKRVQAREFEQRVVEGGHAGSPWSRAARRAARRGEVVGRADVGPRAVEALAGDEAAADPVVEIGQQFELRAAAGVRRTAPCDRRPMLPYVSRGPPEGTMRAGPSAASASAKSPAAWYVGLGTITRWTWRRGRRLHRRDTRRAAKHSRRWCRCRRSRPRRPVRQQGQRDRDPARGLERLGSRD